MWVWSSVRHATRCGIRLAEDRRVLAPVARSIYGWKGYYDQRSAVDRVNARWAGGFEHPFIRRLAKMRLRVTMASTDHAGDGFGAHQGQPA